MLTLGGGFILVRRDLLISERRVAQAIENSRVVSEEYTRPSYVGKNETQKTGNAHTARNLQNIPKRKCRIQYKPRY